MGSKRDLEILEQRRVAAALRRLEKMSLSECFDPTDPESRPNKKQLSILKDITRVKYRFVTAGNQCLVGSTQVLTDKGPVQIKDIKIGDIVYSEHGKPIRVKEVFSNGPKQVYSLISNKREWARATAEHVWLAHEYDRNCYATGKLEEVTSAELGRCFKVAKRFVRAPLGSLSVPNTYALGALQGDGCSRERRLNSVTVSSADAKIPTKISEMLGATSLKKNHEKNYNWQIYTDKTLIPYYMRWCHERYAHEKIIDLDEIKKWDRTTLLQWLAGLYDTEGSLSGNIKARTICWNISMQAESVMQGLQYALLALFQLTTTLGLDAREKYKNGPVHVLSLHNPHDIKRVMAELDPLIVSDQKRWKPIYDSYGKRSFSDRVALTRVEAGIEDTFDIHVDSPTNLYLLANGLVTHNSGKSQLAAREITWILTDTHPYWQRPARWSDEPLLILVAGQDRKNMEVELWDKKISPFLDKQEWREMRQGGSLQYVENKLTKDKILFLTHSDSSEKNRRHMQGYVAHYVWIDEMPGSEIILEELQRRVDARDGYLIATFTPKFKNDKIRKVIDAAKEPLAKQYKMSKLDNPIYASRLQEELDKLDGYSAAYKNSILYGDWFTGDSGVYHFDSDLMVEDPGPEYHASWRHTVAVDPAIKSKCGFTLWAENPNTGVWYLVRDAYIDNVQSTDDMFDRIERQLTSYHVVRRISDTMPYFITHASQKGKHYLQPFSKNDRKMELIQGLQDKLSRGQIKIAPWCTTFIDEIQSCQWSETSDRIVNASSYHTLDASQYFCDLIPVYTDDVPKMTRDQYLKEGHRARLKREYAAAKMSANGNTAKPIKQWGRQRIRKVKSW